MGDKARYSDSCRKALKDRFASGGEVTTSFRSNLGRLGSSISRGLSEMVSPGSGEDQQGSADYGAGVRQLNSQGHEVYNLDDDCEIFISKVSDYALFDDPVLEKVPEGGYAPVEAPEPVSFRAEAPEERTEDDVDVSSLFANVERGSMSEYTVSGFVSTDGATEPAAPRFVENYEAAAEEEAAPAEDPVALRPEYEVFMNRLRTGTIHSPVRAAAAEPAADAVDFPSEAVLATTAAGAFASVDDATEAAVEAAVAESVMCQVAFEEAVDSVFCSVPEVGEPVPEESLVTADRIAGVPAAAPFAAFAETSAEAMPAASAGAVAGIGTGIDAEGEGLPKMRDPQVRRPSSMRFRFDNGILTNVSAERKEELRGPLD